MTDIVSRLRAVLVATGIALFCYSSALAFWINVSAIRGNLAECGQWTLCPSEAEAARKDEGQADV